jgi:hypothetical protein
MPPPTMRAANADAVFLAALENGHSVRTACRMAQYTLRSVYRWRGGDAEFASRWATAVEMAGDLWEEEADRRGRDGYDVPVFHRGEVCGAKKVYANGLLLARLKAIRPEQYRERVTAPSTENRSIAVTLRDFTLERLAQRPWRGEKIEMSEIPPRIQELLEAPDTESRTP